MKCEHEKLFGSITLVLILLFWFFELERGSQWVGANTPTPTPTATPTPTPVPCDGFTIPYFPTFDTNVPQVINFKLKQGDVDVTGKTLQLPFTGAIETGMFISSAGIIKDGHNPETSWEENRDWDARIIWQPYCFLPDGMYMWYFDYGIPDGGGTLVNGWEKWADLEIEPAPAETPEPGAYTYTYTWEDKPQIGNGSSTKDEHVDSRGSATATIKWVAGELSVNDTLPPLETVTITFSTEPSVSAFDYVWNAYGAIVLIDENDDEVTQLSGENMSSVTAKSTETDCGVALLYCTSKMERYPWMTANESPDETISVNKLINILDPCTNTPRCGEWVITTYYTPKESSYTGLRDYPMPLKNGHTIYCREAFMGDVNMEGWGQIDPSDTLYGGIYAGKYISYYDDDTLPVGHWISDNPIGNHGNILVPNQSLATDQENEIPYQHHAGFDLGQNNDFSGGSVCGQSADVGGAVNGKHIDFYVGIYSHPGSTEQDTYEPYTEPGNKPVAVDNN